MENTVKCSRCARTAPALPRAPYPGDLGTQLIENACTDCWAEWEKLEVMVINELRLNFMDPKAMDTLSGHLREFFFLQDRSKSSKPAGPAPTADSAGTDG